MLKVLGEFGAPILHLDYRILDTRHKHNSDLRSLMAPQVGAGGLCTFCSVLFSTVKILWDVCLSFRNGVNCILWFVQKLIKKLRCNSNYLLTLLKIKTKFEVVTPKNHFVFWVVNSLGTVSLP